MMCTDECKILRLRDNFLLIECKTFVVTEDSALAELGHFAGEQLVRG